MIETLIFTLGGVITVAISLFYWSCRWAILKNRTILQRHATDNVILMLDFIKASQNFK
ncbi:MAG: hypothetical protein K2M98_04800 [Muribaculum sp.]|nr:hypothetical protein [Muribaculum sp.]